MLIPSQPLLIYVSYSSFSVTLYIFFVVKYPNGKIYNTLRYSVFLAVKVFPSYNTVYSYLLTPWSRVLLEKLTGSAASQEIPRIFGTRSFIIVLTSARQLSLS